jgi:hypothetical protein
MNTSAQAVKWAFLDAAVCAMHELLRQARQTAWLPYACSLNAGTFQLGGDGLAQTGQLRQPGGIVVVRTGYGHG